MDKNSVSILIVEDSQFMAGLVEKALKSAGYTNTHIAVSGNQALKMIEKTGFDILFLDINMNDGDGIFTLTEINKKFYKLGYMKPKCIVVSAVNQDEVKKEVSSLGAFGYIQKPFNEEDIVNYADKAASVIFK
ncbi:MAG: response regulator [Candidatus Nanoarchaeia archaeon]